MFCFTLSTDKLRSLKGSVIKRKKQVARNTYVPLFGREKGVPHYYPTPNEILKILQKNFTDVGIIVDEEENYLLITCYNKKA